MSKIDEIIKSREGKTVVRNGPGILSLLTVAFVILKLCGVIDWGWWIVLAPIVVPNCLVLLVICAIGIHFCWTTTGIKYWYVTIPILVASVATAIFILNYLITLIGGLF